MFTTIREISRVRGITDAPVALSGNDQLGRESRCDIRELHESLDRLTVLCEAMWVLLRDKAGVTEQDLMDMFEVIDLSDGVADGRVRRPPVTCAACRRRNAPRHARCVFCGESLAHGSAFETV
jgi:hypothetical protein